MNNYQNAKGQKTTPVDVCGKGMRLCLWSANQHSEPVKRPKKVDGILEEKTKIRRGSPIWAEELSKNRVCWDRAPASLSLLVEVELLSLAHFDSLCVRSAMHLNQKVKKCGKMKFSASVSYAKALMQCHRKKRREGIPANSSVGFVPEAPCDFGVESCDDPSFKKEQLKAMHMISCAVFPEKLL